MCSLVRPARILVLVLGGVTVGTSAAQTVLHEFLGQNDDDRLGEAVASIADLDGDGVRDLLVGAIGDDTAGANQGACHVVSGADGSPVRTFYGGVPFAGFGQSVAAIGDVSGDGLEDVVVGAPLDNGLAGAAFVLSSANGQVLHQVNGVGWAALGMAVAGLDDVDGDGVADFVVGAPTATGTGGLVGRIYVHSGATGVRLYDRQGPTPPALYGQSLASLGDIDGDGRGDFVVGAEEGSVNGSRSGSVFVHSGATGNVLFTLHGAHANMSFGTSVAAAGDVDGDGVTDFVVGAPRDSFAGGNSGSVHVFSGATGLLLHTVGGSSADEWAGSDVAGVGDLDGDGLADFAASAPSFRQGGAAVGRVVVHSGATGAPLAEVVGTVATARFGDALVGPGDLDGDGFGDLYVSAWADSSAGSNRGRATAFSLVGGVGTRYCSPSMPNSTGQGARVSATGSRAVSANDLTLIARALPLQSFGFFLASRQPGHLVHPGGSQGVLCLSNPIGRFVGPGQIRNSGTTGTFELSVDLQQMPTPTGPVGVVAGDTWHFQAWYRDANPNPTSNFTDGVAVTFQ